jgi:hypothetical protein
VLIAMTSKPYRREVLDAVAAAKRAGRDRDRHFRQPRFTLMSGSPYGFVGCDDTPQFFPSTRCALAFLETLMSFVIADATA